MKIKVCGMRQAANIAEVGALPIHFMGFIFYEKSPRFVVDAIESLRSCPDDLTRVGVFVNADIDFVLDKIIAFELNAVQLHGSETPLYVHDLAVMMWKKHKIQPHVEVEIIKAFSVDEHFDFNKTKDYEGLVNYFLFDTKTPQYGGAGVKFDWTILEKYTGETPFLLAGGITEHDVDAVLLLQNKLPQLYGLDLNSKFEIEPALKDVEKLRGFIEKVLRY
ncbi:MAG: phosphoribosylanthranilate isomerase [Saprospiraceae bacterium]|nr:phosphoribosylanthranilate isomerase [Saprospiraceae bacterium]